MAGLWTGTAINSNETAKVVNQLAERKSLPMVVKLNALLYAFMGKEDGANNTGKFGGAQSQKVSGKNIEVPLMGKLPTPAAISDGSDEYTTATPNYSADVYGAAEFPIAHYGLVQAIPDSEMDRFRGDEAKTLSYIDEVYDYVMYGYENVFGTAIHAASTAVPARSTLGSWQAAVDDANTYGTIDRSDAGNVDYRGIVAPGFGDTTLAALQEQINTARGNLGNISTGVTGTTLFNKIQGLVQAYTLVTYDQNVAKFGAPHVHFAGVDFMLDQRTSSGVIGLFDPRHWLIVQKEAPFTSTGIVKDFTKKATHILNTTVWIQLICKKPNAQIKITDAN